MRAGGIRTTATVVDQTTICKTSRMEGMSAFTFPRLTSTNHGCIQASVGKASLARADDCICCCIMGTDSIRITTTLIDLATVCKMKASQTRMMGLQMMVSPVQTTFDPHPVSVNPVLQVHFATLVVLSCVQMASGWHPPLLTSHRTGKRHDSEMRDRQIANRKRILRLQTTFESVPTLVYPVLQVH